MSSKTRKRDELPTQSFVLCLPQVYPTMTVPDTLTIVRWYVQEGDVLHPLDPGLPPPPLLDVDAPYGEIEITIPPFLRVPHRVISLLPQHATMHLGDQFLTLQPLLDVA